VKAVTGLDCVAFGQLLTSPELRTVK